jgi:hypothetical protein
MSLIGEIVVGTLDSVGGKGVQFLRRRRYNELPALSMPIVQNIQVSSRQYRSRCGSPLHIRTVPGPTLSKEPGKRLGILQVDDV